MAWTPSRVDAKALGHEGGPVGAAVVGDGDDGAERKGLVQVAAQRGDAGLEARGLVVDGYHDLDQDRSGVVARARAACRRGAPDGGAACRPFPRGRARPKAQVPSDPPQISSEASAASRDAQVPVTRVGRRERWRMGRKDQIRCAERHPSTAVRVHDSHADVQGLWRKVTVASRTVGFRVTVPLA